MEKTAVLLLSFALVLEPTLAPAFEARDLDRARDDGRRVDPDRVGDVARGGEMNGLTAGGPMTVSSVVRDVEGEKVVKINRGSLVTGLDAGKSVGVKVEITTLDGKKTVGAELTKDLDGNVRLVFDSPADIKAGAAGTIKVTWGGLVVMKGELLASPQAAKASEKRKDAENFSDNTPIRNIPTTAGTGALSGFTLVEVQSSKTADMPKKPGDAVPVMLTLVKGDGGPGVKGVTGNIVMDDKGKFFVAVPETVLKPGEAVKGLVVDQSKWVNTEIKVGGREAGTAGSGVWSGFTLMEVRSDQIVTAPKTGKKGDEVAFAFKADGGSGGTGYFIRNDETRKYFAAIPTTALAAAPDVASGVTISQSAVVTKTVFSTGDDGLAARAPAAINARAIDGGREGAKGETFIPFTVSQFSKTGLARPEDGKSVAVDVQIGAGAAVPARIGVGDTGRVGLFVSNEHLSPGQNTNLRIMTPTNSEGARSRTIANVSVGGGAYGATLSGNQVTVPVSADDLSHAFGQEALNNSSTGFKIQIFSPSGAVVGNSNVTLLRQPDGNFHMQFEKPNVPASTRLTYTLTPARTEDYGWWNGNFRLPR